MYPSTYEAHLALRNSSVVVLPFPPLFHKHQELVLVPELVA